MLNARHNRILNWVIRLYLQQGEPVGSRILSEKCGLNLSPASIRKVMSSLEDQGLLYSPHTSAGRVPTDQGLRYFVNTLMTIDKSQQQHVVDTIVEDVERAADVHEAMHYASRGLANLTHFAGLASVREPGFEQISKVELIPISTQRILVVVVSAAGEVHHQLFPRDPSMSDARLAETSYLLSELLVDCSLREARLRLRHEMEVDRLHIRKLIRSLSRWAESSDRNNAELYVSGQKQLLDIPELRVVNTVRSLLAAFDEKKMLMHLIEEVEQANTGVKVFIGSEHALLHMEEVSVVLARYKGAGHLTGTLGVIGPRRMHYEKVVPLVECTARRISSMLGGSL
jgi:heat-inducible transcriptional repressor